MPTRFETYRMRDGVTPLAQDYFNTVFADIDTRIAELEQRRADWQEVVDELTAFGLQRIDSLVGQSMAEVNAMIEQLRQRRDELEAAIGNVADLATGAQLTSAVNAERDARQQADADLAQALASAISAEQAARTLAIGLAVARPSAASFTYDATGRISQITETLPTGARVTVLTYNAAGRVTTAHETHAGHQRETAYSYDAGGRVDGFTVTET